MSCQKHKLRKRGNCPDCFPVHVKAPITGKTKPVKEEKVIVKTSRDMLADLEKEADNIVVKKERKKREVVINTAPPKEEESDEIKPLVIAEIEKKIAHYNIDLYFDTKMAEFKSKIASVAGLQWEHLDIPAGKCNMETICMLEKDGFQYIDMYVQENIMKVSGFTVPTAVFQRLVKNDRKKTTIQWKKELK